MKTEEETKNMEMKKRHEADELLGGNFRVLYYVTTGWIEALKWWLEN